LDTVSNRSVRTLIAHRDAPQTRPLLADVERCGVGLISGYAWILPAVIAAGWILSWWGPRPIRWGLLPAATVISGLCVVIGVVMPVPPVSPESPCHPGQFQCMPQEPINWIVAGLIGFACCLALLLVTIVVEFIIWIGRRSGAFPRT
jgi:hypothetical protein